jgi:hypothetical protein
VYFLFFLTQDNNGAKVEKTVTTARSRLADYIYNQNVVIAALYLNLYSNYLTD